MPTARAADPMTRLRQICLTLPEAYEQETWGEATFRVRKKIFCMAGSHEPALPSASLKSTHEDQRALLSQGSPYFLPAYVGSKGWIGVELHSPQLDWQELTELVIESYRLIAPKRLSAQLG